jgi:hypothetical protein
MAAVSTNVPEFTLTLNEEERTQLVSLLEQTLRDTHVEARRTEAPAYQEQVHHQERLLRGVIEKLRRTGK